MKRVVLSLVMVALVVTALASVTVAAPTEQVEAFLEELGPCVTEASIVDVEQAPCLPAGCYCMYYQDDPAWSPDEYHGFGWYPCRQECNALYPLVREPMRGCCFNILVSGAPHEVLPPGPGIAFQIPDTHAPAGFYLNNPYGNPEIQGLYYTDPSRNPDGLQHAYIFRVEFRPGECRCSCNGLEAKPIGNTMYVIVWEDGCNLYDGDFNDFIVALIPIECPCQ